MASKSFIDEKPFDPESAIYTPQEVAAYAVQSIEEIQKNKHRAISLGIPGIKDYFAPILPGQTAAVIAQTSNYKTGFMDCWSNHVARQLMQENRDEVIVWVSVEEDVEDLALAQFAKVSGEDAGKLALGDVQDWDRLMQAAAHVGTIPIYRIGMSLARAEDIPNLNMTNMLRSIKYLRDKILGKSKKIAIIFFDYLQAFAIDESTRQSPREVQRRLQVRSDVYSIFTASKYFGCPCVVGVQAKQNLDGPGIGPNWRMPGIYDGEETSSIAQRFYRIIQLWMPKMTHTVGSVIEHKGNEFKVEENLLFVKVGKQKGRLPSGRVWKCIIRFRENEIAPEATGYDDK